MEAEGFFKKLLIIEIKVSSNSACTFSLEIRRIARMQSNEVERNAFLIFMLDNEIIFDFFKIQ